MGIKHLILSELSKELIGGQNMSKVKQLTEAQVKELRQFKNKPNGDMLYWDRLAEIYADDADMIERINFEKSYLESVRAIPLSYASHWKTEKAYLDTVDDFNKMVGYTSEPESEPEFKDCLLEEIAAKFGIDIDINGDGMTSFEKYRKNKDRR